ncbi:hypothetical protein ACHAPJ_007508 [Fusarium lateritium]
MSSRRSSRIAATADAHDPLDQTHDEDITMPDYESAYESPTEEAGDSDPSVDGEPEHAATRYARRQKAKSQDGTPQAIFAKRRLPVQDESDFDDLLGTLDALTETEENSLNWDQMPEKESFSKVGKNQSTFQRNNAPKSYPQLAKFLKKGWLHERRLQIIAHRDQGDTPAMQPEASAVGSAPQDLQHGRELGADQETNPFLDTNSGNDSHRPDDLGNLPQELEVDNVNVETASGLELPLPDSQDEDINMDLQEDDWSSVLGFQPNPPGSFNNGSPPLATLFSCSFSDQQ